MSAGTPKSATGPQGSAESQIPPIEPCERAIHAVNSTIPAEALGRFCQAFERSARRWEMIIYPAILALVLTAAGAFFFVYTLTRDMRAMAERVQPEVGQHLDRIAASVQQLTASIDRMSQNMEVMRAKMDSMAKDLNTVSKQMVHMEVLPALEKQMVQMNVAIYAMAYNTESMRWSVQGMNRTMRPMSFMSGYMPW
jgi:hypothetical protein